MPPPRIVPIMVHRADRAASRKSRHCLLTIRGMPVWLDGPAAERANSQ
jgi:hypothetical protein